MPEQNAKEKMSVLTKFVDDNFKPAGFGDILGSFLPLFFVLVLLFMVLGLVFFAWTYTPLTQWIPGLISIIALLVAYNSFIMVSRKYVNKRLAHREAKRLSSLLPDKSNETLCLLPPLVALKQENYHFVKLAVLYEVNKDLFKPDKLMEYYYLN